MRGKDQDRKAGRKEEREREGEREKRREKEVKQRSAWFFGLSCLLCAFSLAARRTEARDGFYWKPPSPFLTRIALTLSNLLQGTPSSGTRVRML